MANLDDGKFRLRLSRISGKWKKLLQVHWRWSQTRHRVWIPLSYIYHCYLLFVHTPKVNWLINGINSMFFFLSVCFGDKNRIEKLKLFSCKKAPLIFKTTLISTNIRCHLNGLIWWEVILHANLWPNLNWCFCKSIYFEIFSLYY